MEEQSAIFTIALTLIGMIGGRFTLWFLCFLGDFGLTTRDPRRPRWESIVLTALGFVSYAWLPIAALTSLSMRWFDVCFALQMAGMLELCLWFAILLPTAMGGRKGRVWCRGPYGHVRHPINGVSILCVFTMWPILPHDVAVYLVPISIAFLITATALEDRILMRDLPGYREYAQTTRYRLIPKIW